MPPCSLSRTVYWASPGPMRPRSEGTRPWRVSLHRWSPQGDHPHMGRCQTPQRRCAQPGAQPPTPANCKGMIQPAKGFKARSSRLGSPMEGGDFTSGVVHGIRRNRWGVPSLTWWGNSRYSRRLAGFAGDLPHLADGVGVIKALQANSGATRRRGMTPCCWVLAPLTTNSWYSRWVSASFKPPVAQWSSPGRCVPAPLLPSAYTPGSSQID